MHHQSGFLPELAAKIQIKIEIKKNLARKIVLQQKKSQNIWNFRIYFVSLHRQRGFRRKDDNLYGLYGRFEPHPNEPSHSVVALFISEAELEQLYNTGPGLD